MSVKTHKLWQEEPVSEKKCMFTNDNYTDEDRKVLCEDCKEKCEYSKKEEPANEELEKEEFVDTEEIINEIDPEHKVCTITDLEDAAMEYFKQTLYNGNDSKMQAFKAGAKWQKEQIEKVLLSEVLPCFMHGGEADEVVAKLDEVLKQK